MKTYKYLCNLLYYHYIIGTVPSRMHFHCVHLYEFLCVVTKNYIIRFCTFFHGNHTLSYKVSSLTGIFYFSSTIINGEETSLNVTIISSMSSSLLLLAALRAHILCHILHAGMLNVLITAVIMPQTLLAGTHNALITDAVVHAPKPLLTMPLSYCMMLSNPPQVALRRRPDRGSVANSWVGGGQRVCCY